MENNIQIINETEAVEIVKQPDLEIPLSIEKLESEIQGINESIGNNNESKIMRINAIQAEWKNLDAIYQERKLKLKAILSK